MVPVHADVPDVWVETILSVTLTPLERDAAQMHRGAIAQLEQYVSSVVPHAQQRQAEDAAIQAAAPLTPASTSSSITT
jgi:hypothetical protein